MCTFEEEEDLNIKHLEMKNLASIWTINNQWPQTLRGGKWEGSAGFAKSQMQISPSSAPDASKFGAIELNSRPRT